MTKFRTDRDVTEDVIKVFEGFRGMAYNDATGSGTIGYGHLLTKKDRHLAGKTLTEAEGEVLLRQDISAHQQGAMKGLKVPLTNNQKAALTSLAFNVGANGTAVKNVVNLMNEGKTEEAANEFLKYNTSKGVRLDALVQRRDIESKLFLTKDGDEISLEEYGSKSGGLFAQGSQRGGQIRGGRFSGTAEGAAGNNAQLLAAWRNITAEINQSSANVVDEDTYLARLRREGSGV